MPVTVTPDTFTMVDFDAATITAIAERLVTEIGLPADVPVIVRVEERTPMGRVRLLSLDPVDLSIEGGAIEDPKSMRKLSPTRAVDVLGQQLFQVRDRLDPAFGAPALGEPIPLPHQVAWDVYAVGRVARLGHPAQHQRRLYQFRNRHGFTDAADAAFENLWRTADGLTWDALVSVSDRARSPV